MPGRDHHIRPCQRVNVSTAVSRVNGPTCPVLAMWRYFHQATGTRAPFRHQHWCPPLRQNVESLARPHRQRLVAVWPPQLPRGRRPSSRPDRQECRLHHGPRQMEIFRECIQVCGCARRCPLRRRRGYVRHRCPTEDQPQPAVSTCFPANLFEPKIACLRNPSLKQAVRLRFLAYPTLGRAYK